MTHDELLAKIENERADYYANDLIINTLRAVVELHKPEIPYGLHNAIEACPIDGDVYPCSTIQAIEKELG
jgi:hypothetical protein